jgi:glycosyltransferase involved in cell wall biosynthesis
MPGILSHPSLSIVTPSFNQGKYIRRTIDSVLSQEIPDIEYMVVDGGSTDATIDILRSYGKAISWVSERDRGQADAVNKGIRSTQGEIIGWINSDDIYYPGALRKARDLFSARPDVDILYGLADHIDETDAVIEPYYNEEWDYERLKDVCFICQPAVFFRRSIVDRFGYLDENLHYCLDYEYWLRIGRTLPFYYLKERLAGSRMYQDNKTLRDAVAVHEEVLVMFRKKLGSIPSVWLYNHAHAVARAAGLTQDTPQNHWRFVKKISAVVMFDAFRYRYYLKPSEALTVAHWISGSLKALRNSRR